MTAMAAPTSSYDEDARETGLELALATAEHLAAAMPPVPLYDRGNPTKIGRLVDQLQQVLPQRMRITMSRDGDGWQASTFDPDEPACSPDDHRCYESAAADTLDRALEQLLKQLR